MFDRLKIWIGAKPWFWLARASLGKVGFSFERYSYKRKTVANDDQKAARTFGSIAWIGAKGIFSVIFVLAGLILVEGYLVNTLAVLSPLSAVDKNSNVDQLQLYSQIVTAIFSIYFATIGIILSAGYTDFRRDIIEMLTNEQVGSTYSQLLIFTAIFCLVATALSPLGVEPGRFVYITGTVLTLLSTLALFPLGQRLFSFFDLNPLIRIEILPNIVRHIEGATSSRNSKSLANHHAKAARYSLEQLFYIDGRAKAATNRFEDSLPRLTDHYAAVLMYYIQRKHKIDQDSYWFPRRPKHQQWFLAGDSKTSMALQMSAQQPLVEDKLDHQWLEHEIIDRLASHIELAFEVGDLDLVLRLVGKLSIRIPAYAERFQFDIGMQELHAIKEIIEKGFAGSSTVLDVETTKVKKIGVADAWAAIGSQLCFETLRRMMTFEKELKQFFEADEWTDKSLHSLPAFLQADLSVVVERIKFEHEVEGQRLSKPKYVQQLAVQQLLRQYEKTLSDICDFYEISIPSFVGEIANLGLSEAATQVILGSLHSHWKLPRWMDDLNNLLGRYKQYNHYTEEPYALISIDIDEMSQRLDAARGNAIDKLGSAEMVGHIFEAKHNDELPDHFGQIYFELAEECICALEKNDDSKLDKVLPMFMALAFLAADSKFTDPSLDVNDEFRLHLVATVINDLASVLGFSILYGAYFGNEKLSEGALHRFDDWIERAKEKQKYLERMVILSNPRRVSMNASPRDLIRFNWKQSFENRARRDGFGDRTSMDRTTLHPNKIVDECLGAMSDASHLFFAKHVMPHIPEADFEVDHRITQLALRLSDDAIEAENESF